MQEPVVVERDTIEGVRVSTIIETVEKVVRIVSELLGTEQVGWFGIFDWEEPVERFMRRFPEHTGRFDDNWEKCAVTTAKS